MTLPAWAVPFREAAAMGMAELVAARVAGEPPPAPDDLAQALWYACHGGQRRVAEYLIEHGADVNWISTWDRCTALDASVRNGHDELAGWLRSRGARSTSELHGLHGH